jgi:hypothetical protein
VSASVAVVDSGEWYCPGCGARYDEAGECTNGHDPIALQPLSDAAAADDGTTAPGIPSPPESGPAAATEPAAAASSAPNTVTASNADTTVTTTTTGDAAAVSPDETTDAPAPGDASAGDSAPADAAPPVASPDDLAGVNSVVAEAQALLARARDILASLGG